MRLSNIFGKHYKVLVTGGAGFIGSHLVDELVEEGHRVEVIDKLSTGKVENLNGKAIFHHQDINSKETDELFRLHRFDYVFHLAAEARIQQCTDDPIGSHKTNVAGTLRLLELSRKYHVQGFVFASSSSVYGDPFAGKEVTPGPIDESTPYNPLTLYAAQKMAAEKYVSLYHTFYDLPTVSFRFFNVYGSQRQNDKGGYVTCVAAFMRDAANGRIFIDGSGEQRRDLVHVSDVVGAMVTAIANGRRALQGDVFNVGSGITLSVNDIAEIFKSALHGNLAFESRPARLGDPLYSCADTKKLYNILRYRPEVMPMKGIADLVKEKYE